MKEQQGRRHISENEGKRVSTAVEGRLRTLRDAGD